MEQESAGQPKKEDQNRRLKIHGTVFRVRVMQA